MSKTKCYAVVGNYAIASSLTVVLAIYIHAIVSNQSILC